MKKLILILIALATPAAAEDVAQWPLPQQCKAADYIVVGRLHVYSSAARVEDDGTLTHEGWAGGVLQVDRVLKGNGSREFRVRWFACCPDELESVELTGLHTGVLFGVWLLFSEADGVNVVWHALSEEDEIKEIVRFLHQY